MSTRNLPEELNGFFFSEAGGVAERLVNVLRLKIGVRGTDGFFRLSGSQQAKEPRDRKPQSADARFSRAHSRVNRDACQLHGVPPYDRDVLLNNQL